MNNENAAHPEKAVKHHAQLVAMINYCLKQRVINKATGKVFIAIASHWSPNGKIFPSRERLAHMCDYKDVRNITLQTKKLKEAGLISFQQKRTRRKSGSFYCQTNYYQINLSALRALFKKAVSQARKAGLSAARKAAKLVKAKQKTDLPTPEKSDPPTKGISNINITKDQNNTHASMVSAFRFLNTSKVSQVIADANQALLTHKGKLMEKVYMKHWRVRMGMEWNTKSVEYKRYMEKQRKAAETETERKAILQTSDELLRKLGTAAARKDNSFTQDDYSLLKEMKIVLSWLDKRHLATLGFTV